MARRRTPVTRKVISVGDVLIDRRTHKAWRVGHIRIVNNWGCNGYKYVRLDRRYGRRMYHRNLSLWQLKVQIEHGDCVHYHYIKAIRYPEGI